MQADYSLEMGREDSALELPWQSEDGRTRYYDLKHHPESIAQIAETRDAPELKSFLLRINTPAFGLETAKCDVWSSREISPEEEIFDAQVKFVSYVDLVFVADEPRLSLEGHEALAKSLCALLDRAPQMSASVEFVIRRCYYHPPGRPDESVAGFCITTYVSGFGNDETEARMRWSIAMALLRHALVQVVR